ncbi:MAG: helicase-related protein, partial [Filifactor alocis]|nr:helicase-related protein [Filifactor alocis]
DLLYEINERIQKDERVLVTTLTKKMAESLTDYLKEAGVFVEYLHSDVETLERIRLVRSLRLGEFHVLVGINLLREGLDIPEVSLVAILDADKEGFLRSETSLIQTIGRAARNANGKVIMYADNITRSMAVSIEETKRRREIQHQYNIENSIVPQSIIKPIHDEISMMVAQSEETYSVRDTISREEAAEKIDQLKEEMFKASDSLDFERAAILRDAIMELEKKFGKK